MVNAKSTAGKIEELESLRGIAALLVVFFHLPKWHPWLDIGPINNGYLMVELFFVLSGFVIYNAYGNRIDSGGALLRFQFLRFGRLYPVHLLFLMAFVGIECAKLLVPAGTTLTTAPFSENTGAALVQQLLLVQALGPTGNEMTFNGPAWSISVEFYTYLLFGSIVFLAGRVKLPIFAAIATVSFALLFGWGGLGFDLLLNCLTGFFLGCLLCAWLARREFALPAPALPAAFAALVAYLAIKRPEAHDWLIFVLSPLLILALLRARETWLTRAMRAPLLTWLGSLSYAVYMSHIFVLSMIGIAMKRGLQLPQIALADGTTVDALPPWGAAIAVLVTIGAVLVVSQFVYTHVEVPLRERSRRLAARRSARLAPG